MSNLVQLLPLGLFMLLTTSLVAIAVRRVRIPYAVALGLVGLVLSVMSSVGCFRSAPGLVVDRELVTYGQY